MRMKRYKANQEQGASIFLGLFAVLIIAGYILVNVNVDKDRIIQERVTQTAWLIKQVSEAARLYVRDQNVAGAAVYQKTALCTTPRAITVNELVLAGYIGASIGEKNTALTSFITPLDQTIQIIAANSNIDSSDCSPTALGNVAATAYIILQPPTQGIDNIVLAALAEALTVEDMPVGNPIFDNFGNNVSDNCGASPATIQWDTGCLNNTQFSFLTGGVPFTNSYMGVPTWLTFRGDNRAVFRYEQAENPAATQMQTNLLMATIDQNNDIDTCAQRQYTTTDESLIAAQPTATKQINSGVCSDTGNRQNINNVGNLTTNRVLNNGFTSTGNTAIVGNVRAFNGANAIQMNDINFTGGTSTITVAPRDPLSPNAPRVVMNDVTADLVQADTGSATNSFASGETSVINAFSVNGGGIIIDNTSGAGRGVLANTMGGTANNVTVSNNATFGGNTSIASQTSLSGSSNIPLAAARINANDVTLNGDITVGNTLTVSGTVNTAITSVGQCVGDCPDRSPDIEPPL